MNQNLDAILKVKSEGKSSHETTSGSSTPPTQTPQLRLEPTPPGLVFAILFYLLAVGLATTGFVVAYQDSSYSIVGGDAYNYIIFAGRGIAWMGSAIVSTVIALGCQLAGHASQLKTP